ncbi:3-hydroxyacyl-CoA dehydrogenase family protein [Bacillus pumilus]|uniref:3-hydroxyacyl-CoA dehydrogenase family protein n=1 Tax=Bacillus pumilus TaxID=1408 RepID=UPI0011E905C2|nr:3-hydroxyacyl-CoA dehydrogenase NAD-binding domain-containing protein [Bacillus pumilus]TYS31698.1 3-hydroxyacyl-CoA dehydrogenase [Bacillus pumilus]TYS47336.1 3-hydroxyacyl-CoA dehydrogenase [Bacillus pumilus]
MTQISIIGAGTMGRGIAYSAASNGFTVSLYDIEASSLSKAKSSIQLELEKSAKRNFIKTEDIHPTLQRISYSDSLEESVRSADLVIEAVVENMAVKLDVFKELDQLTKPETILATNTSTMSPTEIGAITSRPEKVVAMHFFNPVHKMKLVEIIRGLDTSDETVNYVKEVTTQLKKEYVEVNEFPGFVTSRMNCLIGNEAMNMLMEGVASAEDIDKACKLGLNHPMGPLALADLVGLDSRLRNMEYLYQTLGEKYRPSPLLTKYVKAGKLGVKSGEGFFHYQHK